MNVQVQSTGNDRDAHVVEEICGFVTAPVPRSFFLFAGAGSGKTRTLVEVLRRITGVVKHEAGGKYAKRLHSQGQAIRVITYTKNATDVITGRLGKNDLAAVSTIHAFCWELIQGFDVDIREALLALKDEELAIAKQAAAEKKNGETDTDRRKYAEIADEAEKIRIVEKFIYHPDRNTYGIGALAHATVLAVAAWLVNHRPTLRRILEEHHPLVLIDESQDTMRGILDALLNVEATRPGKFTLGLLGDHRQRIYPDGHRDLPAHVPTNWAFPALKMNHRSQKRIVDLINAIWHADIAGRTQPKSGFAQYPREEKSAGTVRIFIGDAALATAEKVERERQCAAAMAKATGVDAWTGETRKFKTLALEHKLAAKRGGFFDAYFAMDLLDEDAAAPKSNGERTGPAMVRPLLGSILDLAACFEPTGDLDEFAAMDVLRAGKALAHLPEDVEERRTQLAKIHDAVTAFGAAIRNPGATVREVLNPLLSKQIFDADDRLVAAFADDSPPPDPPKVMSKEERNNRLKRGWGHLFKTPWSQIARYRDYLHGEAELATHQVVKGSEFQHVMVVMDDYEARGFLFSYDKVFGAEPLSKGDNENVAAGKETTVDRTLRLLYVTCSRAEESLALVLWAGNRAAAVEAIKAMEWFQEEEISLLD
ncbi:MULTISPECIES: UvrD-helicase domain-containing protein [Pectobacterium]|uniref:UvrD-helicase domain-containing protein n=1 Tax=Pectobacterium TaxID=122277 RepID=UPI000EB10558|nr:MULTISPECIES: UvrD-helicase domain-containing protein [Pectobacterium]AYH07342.1 Fis family transcriptional regulator [Pectobacterium parmentieri]